MGVGPAVVSEKLEEAEGGERVTVLCSAPAGFVRMHNTACVCHLLHDDDFSTQSKGPQQKRSGIGESDSEANWTASAMLCLLAAPESVHAHTLPVIYCNAGATHKCVHRC